MDLSKFQPKPHPSRAVFKKHRIPISTVSRFLDLNYHYTSNLLNGTCKCTPENDEKLHEFAKMVKEEAESKGGG